MSESAIFDVLVRAARERRLTAENDQLRAALHEARQQAYELERERDALLILLEAAGVTP